MDPAELRKIFTDVASFIGDSLRQNDYRVQTSSNQREFR